MLENNTKSQNNGIKSSYYRFGAFLSLLLITAFTLSSVISAFLDQQHSKTVCELPLGPDCNTTIDELGRPQYPRGCTAWEEDEDFIDYEPTFFDIKVEEEPELELLFEGQERIEPVLQHCLSLPKQEQKSCTNDILRGYFTEYYIQPAITKVSLEEIPDQIWLSFTVDTIGTLVNAQFLNRMHPAIQKNMFEVVKKMQAELQFKPGSMNAKLVAVRYILPIERQELLDHLKLEDPDVDQPPFEGDIIFCEDPLDEEHHYRDLVKSLERKMANQGIEASAVVPPPPPPPPLVEEVEELFHPIERMAVLKTCQDESPYWEQTKCTERAVFSFLGEHLKYPKGSHASGKVIIQYTITEEGKIIDPKVIRGLDKACDKAALKVVKKMARKMQFQPATIMGKTVDIQMNLPIRFRLE